MADTIIVGCPRIATAGPEGRLVWWLPTSGASEVVLGPACAGSGFWISGGDGELPQLHSAPVGAALARIVAVPRTTIGIAAKAAPTGELAD